MSGPALDTMKINNRRDVLLLLLYSTGRTENFNEPISGRTRLVKMLFLFKNDVLPKFIKDTQLTEDNFYKFFPWDFGPFSVEVYDDLSFFQLRGFIETKSAEEEPLPEAVAEWTRWRSEAEMDDDVDVYEEDSFRLTEKGLAFTAKLYQSLSTNQKAMLAAFKSKLSEAPLRGILRYVYQKYPEQTTKSTIKQEVLGDVT
jgi:uncharacterized protein YwgA